MEEISDEQQAAMALKLMDNVKQMIVDTVVANIRAEGDIGAAIYKEIMDQLADTHPGGRLQTSVKQIVRDQMGKY